MRPSAFGLFASFFLLAITARCPAWAQDEVILAPLWVRVADVNGEIDRDHDTASTESAEFSPDGTLIVAGTKKGGDVSVWRVVDGERLWRQEPGQEVEAVAFSRDGVYVAAGGEDGRVHIYRATDGTPITVLEHSASVEGLRFSHDGAILATGSEAGEVNLWRVADWDHLYVLKHGPDQESGGPPGSHADINQVDWSTDDRYLITASRNRDITIWEVPDNTPPRPIRTLTGHTGTVKSIRLSPDGRLVAAGAGDASGVRLWEFETGEQVAHIEATGMIMETVAFTPDGRYLITGGNQGEGEIGAPVENPGFENNNGFGHIRFYRLPERVGDPVTLVLEVPVFRQEYLDFTDNGRLLVTAHEDGTVRLWQVTLNSPTGYERGDLMPERFRLQGNHPNPANPITTATLHLPEEVLSPSAFSAVTASIIVF